jgi:hypothetical protein
MVSVAQCMASIPYEAMGTDRVLQYSSSLAGWAILPYSISGCAQSVHVIAHGHLSTDPHPQLLLPGVAGSDTLANPLAWCHNPRALMRNKVESFYISRG